jgi:hypothetical protein
MKKPFGTHVDKYYVHMSTGNARWLTRREAASILGVTPDMVTHWGRKGLLERKYSGCDNVYLATSVTAFAEARAVNPPVGKTERVSESLALARIANKRVEQLERMLGLRALVPGVDEESIRSLTLAATNAVNLPVTDELVDEWCDRLFGVCDVILERVEAVTGTKEPWAPFVRAGTHMFMHIRLLHPETVRKLNAARRALRHAVFIYCARRDGLRTAQKHFPDVYGDEHDIVLRYALA